MNLGFITWNVDPAIFRITDFLGMEEFAPRYYGISWALAFVLSGFVMEKLFAKDGVSKKLVESLTMYIILGTIIGARLGHCLFYNEGWHYFKNPHEILYIWEGGLASHGAAIGICLALYLFNRKHPLGYLWMVDRLVIAVAISGCLIRVGNLMNSEITGKPTDASYAFVFAKNFDNMVDGVTGGALKVEKIKATGEEHDFKGMNLPEYEVRLKWMDGSLTPEDKQGAVAAVVRVNQANNLNTKLDMVFLERDFSLDYDIQNKAFTMKTHGIPRHAAQLYEALSCLIIFAALLLVFFKTEIRKKEGMIFGIFLAVLFTLRFLYEFLKEVQEDFEEGLMINMGQTLSIIPVLIGLYLIFIYKHEITTPEAMEKRISFGDEEPPAK